MTIYDDGVAGETIDMTALITKEDLHKLMVDKGFEKLSAAEIELQNKEKSQLLSSGGANTQKEKTVQRRERVKGHAEEQDRQRKENSQLLSTDGANTQKEKAVQRREALKGRAEEQDRLRKAEGFEKLSAAEIELQNKEKSQLLSTGGTNTDKEKAVQRRETLKDRAEEQDSRRNEERKRKKEDREILGTDSLPNYMVQLYVGVFGVLLVVVYGGMRRERQRRRKPAASRVRLSS
jgi:hypothetical protein